MYARDHALIATPIGTIRLEGDEEVLTAIRIGDAGAPARGGAAAVRAAVVQLEQWFAKERETFDLKLAPAGTVRGEALRAGLIAVGYGDTLSYGALARMLGSSPRAIGQLCARNPFPIVVPCHRVLASTGALHGFSAPGGIATKRRMLEIERAPGFTQGSLFI